MRAVAPLLPLLALAGCDLRDWGRADLPSPWQVSELAARAALETTPIDLSGLLRDASGAPIAGATCDIAGATATTTEGGSFSFTDLPRQNALLWCEAEGFHPLTLPVHLLQPLDTDAVELPPIPIQPVEDGVTRFLFAGDFALGRRFLDPDEDTPRDQIPPDDPSAWIQASDPETGTLEVVSLIPSYFDAADYRAMNFESPILDDPSTPHLTKPYAFYTLPGSLVALDALGIDYVSMGNNHVYDYLLPGLEATLENIETTGVGYSGIGMTPGEAFVPWRDTVGGVDWSIFSACSITGAEYYIGFLANESQGGAADLNDTTTVQDTIAAEVDAGYTPIAILHMGDEYTHKPTSYMLNRMERAVEAGAELLIAHHPHVAQGFGRVDGVMAAYGLGNFIFDQDRLETMLGLLAQFDMGPDGDRSTTGIPIYIEDYRPRPVTGGLADVLIRRIGEFSDVPVAPYLGWGWVEANSTSDREFTVSIDVPESGLQVLDLRQHLAVGESAVAVQVEGAQWAWGTPGRDIMYHGTFEDEDVDGDWLEAARWDTEGDSRDVCVSGAMRGTAGLCSWRASRNADDSVTAFRNRVRVWGDATNEPVKDVTLLGYSRGDNAGAITVNVRYMASEGEALFGEEIAWTHDAGDWDWEMSWGDLSVPSDVVTWDAPEENPRALRFYVHQAPPESGFARASFDDFAVVTWDGERADLSEGLVSSAPNAQDFLRVEAPAGSYTVRVAARSMSPAAAR